MRILILTPDDIFKPMGGLGESIKYQMQFFEKFHSDIFFDIICPSNYHSANNYCTYPINCRISFKDNYHDTYTSILLHQSEYVAMFYKVLKNNKYDVIISQDWSVGYASKILSDDLNIPLIYICQLSICKTYKNNLQSTHMCKHIELSLMESAQLTIFTSEYYKDLFKFYTRFNAVIENGIDLDEWNETPAYDLSDYKDKINLVYIGRFSDEKNFHTLIDVELPISIQFHIIGCSNGGSPMLYDKVVELSKKNKNITFWGPKYNKEKIALLKAMDVQIIPSTHEPFGIVALEALAAKNFVISSFQGGLGEILTTANNEKLGLNCGITKDSIEECIMEYVELTDDKKIEMTEKGYEHVKQYNWETVVGKYRYIFEYVSK